MSADQVHFLRCQVNRVLIAMGVPEVAGGDLIDTSLVNAAAHTAAFVDGYRQIQPAKKFDVYKTVTAFLAAPSPATLEAARGALSALLFVVAEYEGVENTCGDFDVQIAGVWPPPPAPPGTDVVRPLDPIPVIPQGAIPNFILPIPSLSASKLRWFLVGGAVIGGLMGVAYARRKRAKVS